MPQQMYGPKVGARRGSIYIKRERERERGWRGKEEGGRQLTEERDLFINIYTYI